MSRKAALRTVVGGCVFALAAAVPGLGLEAGCAESERGALMLAVTTDMRAPKDVNVVSVAVQVDGQLKYNFLGRVTPEGEVLLPATLAIVEDNPDATIRVRVIAFKDTKPRVLRDVVTTPPRAGRVALLRMPISFINEESATGALPQASLPPSAVASFGDGRLETKDLRPLAGGFDAFGTEVGSACPDPNQTFVDGVCAPSRVDPGSLPEFTSNLVFGDKPGDCFDCTKCFKGWREVVGLNLDTCTATKDAEITNVGLLTASTGACDLKGQCYVPIDRANEPTDGWKEEGNTLRLPRGVCKKVREGSKLVVIGSINEGCTAKTSSLPVCTGPTNPPLTRSDAGTDAGLVRGEKVTTANLPSAVAVYADRIYFGGRDGIFMVPTGQASQRLPGSPTGPILAPWHVAQRRDGIVAFAIGSTIDSSGATLGYVLAGSAAAALAPITFDQPIGGRLHGVTAGQNEAFWAVTSQVSGEGDIAVSGFTGSTRVGLYDPRQVTAVSKVSTDEFFVGDATGGIDKCIPISSLIQCGTPVPVAPSQEPIEGLATADALATQAFVLRSDGIFVANVDGSNPLTVRRLVTADLLGITDGRYHPRGIAATSKCAFYTSKRGLEYVALDGTTALLADSPDQPALGVAAPILNGVTEQQVYYAVRATAESDGGIYRVKVPASCL